MAFRNDRLMKWRIESGLSQEDAARAIGIAQPYFSELESGKKNSPSFQTLEAISRGTGIPMSEFSTENPSTAPVTGAKSRKERPVMRSKRKVA